MGRVKAELVDGMYVVGDQAYLPEEWAERERDNARRKRNHEKLREQVARWRAANPERARDLNREHMRRKRKGSGYVAHLVYASLHDLRCYGPTQATGCRCKKIELLREVEK